MPPPAYPELAMVMTASPSPFPTPRVVAACYLYPVQMFLHLEFLITNDEFPRRLRHKAIELGLGALLALAAARGSLLIAAPRTLGLEQILTRRGFRDTRATMYVLRAPSIPVYVTPQEAESPSLPAPRQTKPKREGRRATTRQAAGRSEKEATVASVKARKKAVKRSASAKKAKPGRRQRPGLG